MIFSHHEIQHLVTKDINPHNFFENTGSQEISGYYCLFYWNREYTTNFSDWLCRSNVSKTGYVTYWKQILLKLALDKIFQFLKLKNLNVSLSIYMQKQVFLFFFSVNRQKPMSYLLSNLLLKFTQMPACINVQREHVGVHAQHTCRRQEWLPSLWTLPVPRQTRQPTGRLP